MNTSNIKGNGKLPPLRGGGAYAFLFKPLFFIFSLLFGSWLVLKIEKLSPSDFGKYRSLFEKEEPTLILSNGENINAQIPFGSESQKSELKKLIFEYKNGFMDSILFETKLEEFLRSHSKNE